MSITYLRKYLGIICIILLSAICVDGSINGENLMINSKLITENHSDQTVSGFIDVSPQEVWDMCSSTTNGITLPIDVRTDSEWLNERINTPYPEFPRHYDVALLYTKAGVEAFINEYNGKDVICYCGVGGRSRSAAQILVDNNFSGLIYNMVGGITAWKSENLPTNVDNTPPNQAAQPTGPIICGIGSSYTYHTVGTDPDNDTIRYGWNWDGDMLIDTWTDYQPAGISIELDHIWTIPGQFNISVIAEDLVGDRGISSESLSVLVTTPPSNPMVNGPRNGKINEEQTFTISSTDANNDNVFYYIDWDDTTSDGWLGPYPQGTNINISHTWTEKDTYTLQIKSKDINGIESKWTSFEISMPKIISVKPLSSDVFIIFGVHANVKLVRLEPDDNYIDIEILDKPFYVWENEMITTINPRVILRLYEARGICSPFFTICLGTCGNWEIIG